MQPNCKLGFLQVALVAIVLATLGFGLTQIHVPVTKFARVENAHQISAFSSFQTKFPEQCSHVCAKEPECKAASYNRESEECELSRTTNQTGSTNNSAVGWTVYYKTEANTSCIAESCFVFQDISQSWEAANNKCIEQHNGHLARVKSSLINGFLYDLRVRHGISSRLWLGGNDILAPGSWTDGTMVDPEPTTWNGNASVNYRGSGNCIYLVSLPSLKWDHHPCGANNMMSICEFPANKPVESVLHVSSINNNKS